MDNTSPTGFIAVAAASTHGPMYSHGFGTLFLAEAYGMTHRADIREKLQKAVRLIIDTQNTEGGWRYQPAPRDADLSVTICQINALRAARNAGLYVPKDTVEACIRYVKNSQNPDGGFRTCFVIWESIFPRSAAGVVAFRAALTTRNWHRDRIHETVQAGARMRRFNHYSTVTLRGSSDVDPRRRRLGRVVPGSSR